MKKKILLVLGILLLVVTSLFFSGCKIQISISEGGVVSSKSGNYGCSSNEDCTIEVLDTSFSEVFQAKPDDSWVFVGWKSGPYYFCGNSLNDCPLSTTLFGMYEILMAFLESDTVFYLEPKFEQGIPIFDAIGQVQDPVLRQCLEENQLGDYAQHVNFISCKSSVYGKIQTLEGLQQFPLLERLNLHDHEIADLSPLANLLHLRELRLSKNKIADLGPIEQLTKLETLWAYENNVSQIPPLGKHRKLKDVNLSKNRIVDLTPFKNTRPGQLLLFDNPIRNVRPLASLKPSPESFDGHINLGLSSTGLKDLAGLSEIKHLGRRYSSLQLSGNGLKSGHLQKLNGLEVDRLYLTHNDIEDLSHLRQVKITNALDVSHNKLTRLAILSGSSLQHLDAHNNQIWDLSALAHMQPISYLTLRENRIADISPLRSHYPADSTFVPEWLPADEWPYVELDLDDNDISEVGDALDGIHRGRVELRKNPLLCSEQRSLENKTGEYNNYSVIYIFPDHCVM